VYPTAVSKPGWLLVAVVACSRTAGVSTSPSENIDPADARVGDGAADAKHVQQDPSVVGTTGPWFGHGPPPLGEPDRTLAKLRPQFRRCADRADASVAGVIRFRVVIEGSGKASRVDVTERGSLPEAVVECVVAIAESARYGPPARTIEGVWHFLHESP
jgi:hypothetical protein